ncbi:MAG: diaminopimelate decarboxylase [Rhodospirillaceae bacterium]|nr:diaminopimelate decarboxylase [Rhodospirillaceae bacterium]
MSAFTHRDGILHADGVAIPAIAEAVGTPFYCYSRSALVERYRNFDAALAGLGVDIFYAIKANSNLAVIRALALEGAGADVVSIGEVRRALAAGVAAERILFAGVGKTQDEMAQALEAGVGQFNVESESELRALSEVANRLGHEATVGLRVNPDVDAKTHAKITTGRKENKFGVDIERAPEFFDLASNLPGTQASSLSVHIGSQLTQVSPFREAYGRLREMTLTLRQAGHVVDHLDLGGGLGIVYENEDEPDLSSYARIVRETVSDLDCRLSVEPGRFLVGNAGILVTKVVYVKYGGERRFVIVDGAMNDLIRPTLYNAHHDIVPVEPQRVAGPTGLTDIVGPICESGDYFAQARDFPDMPEGALLAILSAGAYSSVMASNYNSRPMAPEVMVDGDRFEVVRRRQSMEDLLALESLPDWLDGSQAAD